MRMKIFFGEGKGRNNMEKESIFLQIRRKTEKEKDGNICRRKIYFCGGEVHVEGKRKKIFGEQKYFIYYYIITIYRVSQKKSTINNNNNKNNNNENNDYKN